MIQAALKLQEQGDESGNVIESRALLTRTARALGACLRCYSPCSVEACPALGRHSFVLARLDGIYSALASPIIVSVP